MTLAQISSFVSAAIRNKLATAQIVLIMDAVQKLAFDENMKAFQVWDEALTTYDTLTFGATYTNAVVGDIGKTVVGTTSGATGVLISYDNTAKEWVISTTEDFADGEAVTITTGTGAGTTDADTPQTGYIGPYTFPTSPAVRKFLGVTSLTEGQIFGTEPIYTTDLDDYGIHLNDYMSSRVYVGGRPNEIDGAFTFAAAPEHATEYRWVYWREAPSIAGIASGDDANLLIPARYHFNFVQACIKCARMTISGESFGREDIEKDLGPWWNTLRKTYTPNGKARNLTSNKSDGWI
jgi:hypothetical protein